MQGTILVIDGAATGRMALKAQLTAACFRVVQADSIAMAVKQGLAQRPDLILSACSLPDGSVDMAKTAFLRHHRLAEVPMIALGTADRLALLEAGIDEVLPLPLDEVMLQARIRSLLRRDGLADALELDNQGLALPRRANAGLAEPSGAIALVTADLHLAQKWKARLSARLYHGFKAFQLGAIQPLMAEPVPEVIVIEVNQSCAGAALRLLADLRARASTRGSVVIAVPNADSPAALQDLAAEALDRGAHDVLPAGFDSLELGLRISAQLAHKRRADQLRSSLRDGLRAAMEDPLTGLKNRRFATPFLDQLAQNADTQTSPFAVLVADLDHFKAVNDQYGHPVGDAVLVEAARRLKACLSSRDLLARVGGEEFMAVLPRTTGSEAADMAARLCAAINAQPFCVNGQTLSVTVSMGLTLGGGTRPVRDHQTLVAEADQALYAAKAGGRNRVEMFRGIPAAA